MMVIDEKDDIPLYGSCWNASKRASDDPAILTRFAVRSFGYVSEISVPYNNYLFLYTQ